MSAVAVVSLMSMIGIRAEAVDALASMITEVFPSLDPRPFISAILAVTSTGGTAIPDDWPDVRPPADSSGDDA